MLRKLTGETVAFAVWREPDGTIVPVRLAQREYDAFLADGGTGDPPGRPSEDAEHLVSGGGIPALDTEDGFPEPGDCWEVDVVDKSGKATGERELHYASASDPEWFYHYEQASDPGRGTRSRAQGISLAFAGSRGVLQDYDVEQPERSDLPLVSAEIAAADIDRTINNHRSVTFDAQASGSVSGSVTLTISGTVTSQANSYIAGLYSGWADLVATTGMKWNGTNLTKRIGLNAQAAAEYWDLVAPSSGTANLVITSTDSSQPFCGGFVSAYGVDQTTPRDVTNSASDTSGTNASPTLSLSGGTTGGLAITLVSWIYQPGTYTDTVDGTWTSAWNLTTTRTGGAAAYRSAASSVTRTDTLSAAPTSRGWTCVGASLKAAAATGVTGTSSVALPLSASGTATVAIAAASSVPLGLTGSATATHPVLADSSQLLPLTGAAASAVAIAASSAVALPVSGSVAGAIGVAAASSVALPLAGTAAGQIAIAVVSSSMLPLIAAASAAVGVDASSIVVLPLAGASTGQVLVVASSAVLLRIQVLSSAAISVRAVSALALPLSWFATVTTGGSIVLPDPWVPLDRTGVLLSPGALTGALRSVGALSGRLRSTSSRTGRIRPDYDA